MANKWLKLWLEAIEKRVNFRVRVIEMAFVLDLIVAGIAVVQVSLTVMVRGSATTTFLGAGLTGVINFALNMNFLIQNWTVPETNIQAIWPIKVFCEDTPSEETESTIEPPLDWPSAGKASFQNVYASYVAGAIDVLEDITFDVEPSQKIGICGRTGSSILSALSKILQISRGSITVDGLELKWISPDALRERLLALPQNPVLVPGKIRENVDPRGTFTDAECISFLEKVGLWEFLEQQGGLDAPANEQTLSVGQSQLLVLARALAHPSSVMMMNEITSSLDAKSDLVIRDIIRENFQNNTIISVAHKLEHLLECDKVVLLVTGVFRSTMILSAVGERGLAFQSFIL
ncbi:ABC transporter, putative [Talaromyces stipitatus ATCC 10500]|uniref:ABC transporter, putative n=1 Tax=Talaromyces stipitatus (strain ATCC 10500 / CBS 375.48 / QM 6759 / NRRL 1006) TaxID=441959 RepID=B8MM67_TALSN|nr:ABC transporter, putative [Talaromyces stipitatus ATCC 10500]EED13579.1 ABC transporter, putative [Talaromyces stipitatus ATCC 10500]